jgi:hypothetical protein
MKRIRLFLLALAFPFLSFASCMETFWDQSFFWNQFGHVLLGDKPAAIGWPVKDALFSPVYFPGSWMFLQHRLGWEEWRRLYGETAYPFILKEFSDGFVYLINVEKERQIVEENLEVFQGKLGKISVDEIMARLENGDHSVIKDHVLLGIALGYGRKNAEAFEQKYFPTLPCKPSDKELVCVSKEGDCPDLCRILPISFVADPDNKDETARLEKLYSASHEKVLKALETQTPMQIAISKLTQGEYEFCEDVSSCCCNNIAIEPNGS